MWAQSKIKNKPVGRYRLSQELKLKGINQDIVNKVLDKVYGETDELTLAQNLISKKIIAARQKNLPVNPDKIYSFLLRRGFSREISQKIYHELNK